MLISHTGFWMAFTDMVMVLKWRWAGRAEEVGGDKCQWVCKETLRGTLSYTHIPQTSNHTNLTNKVRALAISYYRSPRTSVLGLHG